MQVVLALMIYPTVRLVATPYHITFTKSTTSCSILQFLQGKVTLLQNSPLVLTVAALSFTSSAISHSLPCKRSSSWLHNEGGPIFEGRIVADL